MIHLSLKNLKLIYYDRFLDYAVTKFYVFTNPILDVIVK
jgi:hypothetical protein